MMRDRFGEAWCPAGFLVLALLTGGLLAVLLPPGQAADEAVHAIRVDALSRGRLIGHREGSGGGFTTPGTLLEVAYVTAFGMAQTRAERDAAENIRWGGPAVFWDLGVVATYFPAAYVPGAIAVATARALDMNPAQAFRAGRLANVLVFALLGTAALVAARRGRALIAGVLLLPMSLGLAASLSGDGVLIACAALAAALVTRGSARSWWGALALVTVIGLTKLPYAPLLLVLLVTARPALPVRFGVLALAGMLMLGWAGYHQAAVMGVTSRPSYEAGPLWPGPPRSFTAIDPVAQLEVLKADPTRIVTLVTGSLAQDVWIRRHLIGVLGWLHIVLPGWLYALWTGVLALVLAALLLEPGLKPGAAVAGLLGAGLSAWAIILSQYLGWTAVGATAIDGIQGRYFLPLLPFLCLGIPGIAAVRLPGLAAVPLAAGAVGAVTVPLVVALASYLR